MWSWHVLHPEAVTNWLVKNATGMCWSKRCLYSNKSTDLAEISASKSLLLSLFVKNLILVWLVSSVLGILSLRQAQAN